MDNTFSIQLNGNEKLLLEEWLKDQELTLMAQLQHVKSLRSKLNPTANPMDIKQELRSLPKGLSWTNKIINVLKQLNRSVVSKDIIDWFIQNDSALKNKNRIYVSKSVTSKLAVLEQKGIIKKEVVDKKLVYSLVNNKLPSTDANS